MIKEKTTEMALITIVASDGRRAVPAFTSVAALARWSAQARPVPVPAAHAALGALAEGADLLVVDPAGPVPFALAGPMLRAIAEGRPIIEPADDADVRQAVLAAAAAEPGLATARLHPGGADCDLVLALVPDAALDAAAQRVAAQRVAARLAADELLRSRLDRGVAIAVLLVDS